MSLHLCKEYLIAIKFKTRVLHLTKYVLNVLMYGSHNLTKSGMLKSR